MSRPRPAVLLILVPLLALGPAARAATPSIGPQHQVASRTSPVSVPGTGVHRGDRLPTGARLIYRDVALKAGSRARTTTLTVPRGTTIAGLAVSGGADVQVDPDHARYVGRRRAYVLVRYRRTTKDGRVYALGVR